MPDSSVGVTDAEHLCIDRIAALGTVSWPMLPAGIGSALLAGGDPMGDDGLSGDWLPGHVEMVYGHAVDLIEGFPEFDLLVTDPLAAAGRFDV